MVPFAFHKKKGRILFYNLKGLKINELFNTGFILGLNGYHNEKTITNFILVSNNEGIFTYNINKFSLYHKFIQKNYLKSITFSEGYIIENGENTILLGPLFSAGFLYLWDFINKDLIKVLNYLVV